MKRYFLVAIAAFALLASLIPAATAYADDGNNYEVGVYWINDYPGTANDLLHCNESAQGLKDRLVGKGWTAVNDISNFNLWERFFKRVGLGNGADASYTDAVDLAFYSGHGIASGFSGIYGPEYCPWMADTTHDDALPTSTDCQWGDVDLEWMMFDCCRVLNESSYRYWGSTMNGLHLICGAATVIGDSDNGRHVVDLLIDDGWWDWARSVKDSWFGGCDYDQPSGIILRVIGETTDCGNDYIWGQGNVCSDPTHDSTIVSWTYNCG